MEALIVIGYFVVGLALFFSFWRWVALEGDDAGNNFTSCALLFFWPATLLFMVLFVVLMELLELGKRMMK